jgi:AcrR family transcriptional regulator
MTAADTIQATAAAHERTPYRVAARQLLRDTLLDRARELLSDRTWAQVTMGEIAGAAGVSRQTLYKEFGSRNEFAQAFVIREGGRFLDAVELAVRQHLDDPRQAIAGALEIFLQSAAEDPLVRLLLSDDGTGGMLPLVTTQGRPVLDWATQRLAAAIHLGWPGVQDARVQMLAETLVRLAISHITAPKGSAEQTARALAELLGPYVEQTLLVDSERTAAPVSR